MSSSSIAPSIVMKSMLIDSFSGRLTIMSGCGIVGQPAHAKAINESSLNHEPFHCQDQDHEDAEDAEDADAGLLRQQQVQQQQQDVSSSNNNNDVVVGCTISAAAFGIFSENNFVRASCGDAVSRNCLYMIPLECINTVRSTPSCGENTFCVTFDCGDYPDANVFYFRVKTKKEMNRWLFEFQRYLTHLLRKKMMQINTKNTRKDDPSSSSTSQDDNSNDKANDGANDNAARTSLSSAVNSNPVSILQSSSSSSSDYGNGSNHPAFAASQSLQTDYAIASRVGAAKQRRGSNDNDTGQHGRGGGGGGGSNNLPPHRSGGNESDLHTSLNSIMITGADGDASRGDLHTSVGGGTRYFPASNGLPLPLWPSFSQPELRLRELPASPVVGSEPREEPDARARHEGEEEGQP